MIFGVEVGNSTLTSLNEVSNIDRIRRVEVKVILEVFDEIHVLHNIIKSSDSWERERLVE